MHRYVCWGGFQVSIFCALLFGFTSVLLPCRTALAAITGGEGNEPLTVRGWPEGTTEIFNRRSRIAWWQGPPYGGGQWQAEYRSDTDTLNAALRDFAELDVKNKRIVIHDGTGSSFWLNPNDDPSKESAAAIDWSFMVWEPDKWNQLRNLPVDLAPVDARDEQAGPPAQIEVYAGGGIDWSEVNVPEGIEVIDKRLEAHGFTTDDGTVLEGTVTDIRTGRPVAAHVELQEVETQPAGGYRYSVVAETESGDDGRWVLKMAPPGWYRMVVRSEGYAPRIAGFGRFDDQPRWHSFDTRLAPAASLSGRVTDEAGQPLSEVEVRLANVTTREDRRYEPPQDYTAQTGPDGRFRFEGVPSGEATVRSRVRLRSPRTRPADGDPG